MTVTIEIPLPCSQLVHRLNEALREVGLDVSRSFDLQSAREALVEPESCPCPYHGTSQCTCQYVVLQVSRGGGIPFTVVAHGYGEKTEVTLVEPDEGFPDEDARRQVTRQLSRLSAAVLR